MSHTAIHTSHAQARGRECSGRSIHQELAETLVAMANGESVGDAAAALANGSATASGGARFAVATSSHATCCRLQAASGIRTLDRRAERVRAIEAALDESILSGGEIIYDRLQATTQPAKTHSHLASQLNCRWIVSSPIVDTRGRTVGAWLAWGETEAAQSAAMSWIRATGPSFAPALRVVVRAEHGVFTRLRDKISRRLGTRSKRCIVSAIIVVVALLMMLPLPYRIDGECIVEPVCRRFVAAPFNAPLLQSIVEPGDVVKVGQSLATLDGREIRWELAALAADYSQAEKARDAALAERKTAASQLARLEMKQLSKQIEMLESRQGKLEISSPIDGVVVAGDLKRAIGAPLSTGQTLFEIAPLDRMIVECAVPERDIAYAKEGAEVAIRLDAFPSEPYAGTIRRIRPKAELRDAAQVFIAEVEIPNPHGVMRPGMQGQISVTGPRAALGWSLFHRPVEATARWLGW